MPMIPDASCGSPAPNVLLLPLLGLSAGCCNRFELAALRIGEGEADLKLVCRSAKVNDVVPVGNEEGPLVVVADTIAMLAVAWEVAVIELDDLLEGCEEE
jgi:hypothetical protein